MARPNRTPRGRMGVGALLAALPVAAALFVAPSRALAANDLMLTVGPVEALQGAVCVSYRAERPFTPRLEEVLRQGMPATVTHEIGLWRKRSFWFDKGIVALRSEHQIVYDPWAKLFRVRSSTAPSRGRTFDALDSLSRAVFAGIRVPVASLAALDSTGGYFISVRTIIRPVSRQDLGQVEDWLSGASTPAEGRDQSIGDYLLGIVANLSGLGDRTALARSERFTRPLLAAPQAPLP